MFPIYNHRLKLAMVNGAYKKQHDSGRVSAVPGRVNWACLLSVGVHWGEPSRGRGITRAAQTTGGYFKSSSLGGCLAVIQGKPNPHFSPWESLVQTVLQLLPDRTHVNWLKITFMSGQEISKQCLFMQMFACMCVLSHSHSGHFFSNIKCPEEVNVGYVQPHTLCSYVTIW